MAEGAPKKDPFGNLLKIVGVGAIAVGAAQGLYRAGENNAIEGRGPSSITRTEGETQEPGNVEQRQAIPPTTIEGVIPSYTLEFANDALVSVSLGEGLPPNSIVGVYIASTTFTGRYDVPQRASAMNQVLETYQSYSPTDTSPVGGLYFETSVRDDGTIAIPSWIVIAGQRINVGPGTTFGVLPPGGAVRTHMLEQSDVGTGTLRLS